jgi:predicted HTH domain antitoxin
MACVYYSEGGEVMVTLTSPDCEDILLDAMDFRLLRALPQCAIDEKELRGEAEDPDVQALRSFLAEEISLGKTAELLGLSRFELQESFLRLGVPLHLGPATLDEAWAEIRAARSLP